MADCHRSTQAVHEELGVLLVQSCLVLQERAALEKISGIVLNITFFPFKIHVYEYISRIWEILIQIRIQIIPDFLIILITPVFLYIGPLHFRLESDKCNQCLPISEFDWERIRFLWEPSSWYWRYGPRYSGNSLRCCLLLYQSITRKITTNTHPVILPPIIARNGVCLSVLVLPPGSSAI